MCSLSRAYGLTWRFVEYNIQLDPRLPVVMIGSTRGVAYLPAELCRVKAQMYRGCLNDEESTNMLRYTRTPPATNAANIVGDGLRLLGLRDGPINGFDINVDPEMITVPIRVLPPPQLTYARGPIIPKDGSWNLLSVKFKQPATVVSWGIIVVAVHERVDSEWVQELANGLRDKLKACGMAVPNPPEILPARPPPPPHNDPGRRKTLEHIENAVRGLGTPLPEMVVFLLTGRDRFVYPGIKTLCDTKLGVHSICMQFRRPGSDRSGRDKYFSNVALKVNTKFGGINHTLDNQALGWLKTTPTMVVGMDVSHPNPGSVPGTPSVAAIVANVDDTFAQFPVSLRMQDTSREVGNPNPSLEIHV